MGEVIALRRPAAPVSTNCTGRTLYCDSREQHRQVAMDNFYTALRHTHVDPLTAWELTQAHGDDYDRLTARVAAALNSKEDV